MQRVRCKSAVTDSLEAVGVDPPKAHVMDLCWVPRIEMFEIEKRIVQQISSSAASQTSALQTAMQDSQTKAIAASSSSQQTAMQAMEDSQKKAIAASSSSQQTAMQAMEDSQTKATAAVADRVDSNASKMEAYMFRYAVLGLLAMVLMKYLPS